MRQSTVLILIAHLTASFCFMSEDAHINNFAQQIDTFVNDFKEKFDVIALGELDYDTRMDLGLGYWIKSITNIKIKGMKQSTLQFDKDSHSLQFRAPELTIEILLDDKYTLPIKARNFKLDVHIYTDADHIRCTGTLIDYDDLSVDFDSPQVDYIATQLLNLEIVKSVIKMSELPLKQLIQKSLKDNVQKIKDTMQGMNIGIIESKSWLKHALDNIKGISQRGIDEFTLSFRSLFNLSSIKDTESNHENKSEQDF